MAGEGLVRACFTDGGTCRICGENVNNRKGTRLHHASTHLMRLRESGLITANTGKRRGGHRPPAWPTWKKP